MKNIVPKVFLPRPQRLYPWFRFYRKRLSIDTEKVNEVLSEYGLYLIKKPTSAIGGHRNTSLIVTTSRGKGILKKYKESLGNSTIIQEHSILKYLSQINFPAARLVKTKLRQTLVQQGKDRYVLFDYVEGSFRSFEYIAFPKQTHQFIAIAGEMLASLHDKLADFSPQGYNPDGFKSKTGDRWRDIEWFSNKLAFSVNKTSSQNENRRNNKYILLLQNAKKLETILFDNTNMLNGANLPRQIIHNDYSKGHILLRKNAPPVIIDFEIARLDWRLVDVIVGLRNFCKEYSENRFFYNKGYYCQNKIRTFLSNYKTQVRLNPTELKFFTSVWKLMQTWECICSWHQHSSTGSRGALIDACHKLKVIDWITANQDEIMNTLTMSMPLRK